MTLIVRTTELTGVLLIEPVSYFEDHRGNYTETYNEAAYHEAGINDVFVQDDFSLSRKNVLRGIHGDNGTAKLVCCPYGEIYLVAVNNDPQSDQYRRWAAFTLSENNRHQLYLPPKFGNSFLVRSEQALFHYKQTTYYGDFKQFTLKWNDPGLAIEWPIENPIMSERDSA